MALRHQTRSLGSAVPIWVLTLLLLGACAPTPTPAPGRSAESDLPTRTGAKRVTMANIGEANSLYLDVTTPGSGAPGDNAIEELLNTGLTELDYVGVSRAQLAEAVPGLDNGLWRLLPDGRMETTWNIRPQAVWHDGTPYTSEDLAFTARVMIDPDLPTTRKPGYARIESVDMPAPHTVTVRWSKPYIEAHTMFSRELGLPLPKHILEGPLANDRANFALLPYWTEEFVGTAFKVREFARGSHLTLGANDRFALGRPKIDVVEVRFLADPNALVANILASQVDFMPGRGLNLERAMALEEQWKDGRVESRFSGNIVVYAQFINPNPAIMTNVQFRRALLHAIDRQQLVDGLLFGRTSPAHVFLGSNQPEYPDVESSLVRYEYDARKAAQLIEGLGYSRGPDGGFRDGAGQKLGVELRSEPLETDQKTMFAVADFWQQFGVGIEPLVIPRQRTSDFEYRYTFPGLYLRSHSSPLASLQYYHSAQVPTPENRWSGTNRGRYVDPQLDAFIDQFYSTIPREERKQALRQAMHRITDLVPVMPMFYNVNFTVIGNRMQHVVATKAASGASKTWNAHEWDVK